MTKTIFTALATATLALTSLALPGTASAATTVLDFSGAICGVNGNEACGDSSRIGQNYGDSAIQNVSYRSILQATGTTFEPFLRFWAGNYGNLTNVVYGGADAVNYSSEIVLTPLAGFEVSLLSFQGACYLNRASCQTFPYTIATAGGAGIASGSIAAPATGSTLVSVNSAYFTDGIRLSWGPDGYDGGLDNITFDVRAIGVTGAVPEPATWAMMIMGFGAVGGAIRRSRSRTVAALVTA